MRRAGLTPPEQDKGKTMMMTQRNYLGRHWVRVAALSLGAVLALSACDKGAGGAGVIR